VGLLLKGGKTMTTIQHFIAKICILLFLSVSASKLAQLLITANAANPNQKQTNYDSNVAIRTFDHEPPSPKNKPSPTFVFLPSPSTSLRVQRGGVGGGVTNRIQREFLFNNAIPSQKFISCLRSYSKNTNFLKPFAPFPCEAGEGLGMGMNQKDAPKRVLVIG
jgi:hypothetical protein